MLIHDGTVDREYHINIDCVAYAHVHEYESGPTEYRVDMTNCECFCVRKDEYERIVAYLDKRDYLTAVDSSRAEAIDAWNGRADD
jgi:hypothetical protein